MPSYRFCRPDDIPALVRAVNACFDVYFPDQPALTVARFRREMTTLGLWPSNSMMAVQGDAAIAVMIGTKRDHAVSILRVGVHPDHQRTGHASHLVTSLSQKLAVLGPDRLEVEIPEPRTDLAGFARACGYAPEVALVDYVRPVGPAAEVPSELISLVGVADLDEAGLLATSNAPSWIRAAETLRGRADVLEAAAIVTPERLEAGIFFDRRGPGPVEVLAAGSQDAARGDVLVGLLLRWLINVTGTEVVCPRLGDGEVSPGLLDALGFEAGARHHRWVARATPL